MIIENGYKPNAMNQMEKDHSFLDEMKNDQQLLKKAYLISIKADQLPLAFDLKPLLQELYCAREALLNACLEETRENNYHSLARKEARESLKNVFRRLSLFLKEEEGENL